MTRPLLTSQYTYYKNQAKEMLRDRLKHCHKSYKHATYIMNSHKKELFASRSM